MSLNAVVLNGSVHTARQMLMSIPPMLVAMMIDSLFASAALTIKTINAVMEMAMIGETPAKSEYARTIKQPQKDSMSFATVTR